MSDINNYDPNPYDDVTIDEALAQIYDRVNDRTIRQIVTILKKVIDGISTGDVSRYTVEKTTAESGEVTYKLMQQINSGTPTPVGDTVSLRGSQILADYGGELQILDNIIAAINAKIDAPIDDQMSESSPNAVQNKVITQFVNESVAAKIESSDYANYATGGTVRTWTTVEAGKTVLHIATEDIRAVITERQANFVNKTYTIEPMASELATSQVYSKINRCNVSDDGTINAFYGDTEYTEDGSNGQVMVYIPKFWYKTTPINVDSASNIKEAKWSISDREEEGFTLHPAFYDAAGNEIDYFLYGAFEAIGQDSSDNYGAYNSGADRLSSVGGNVYAPISDLTRATARTMAANRGAGWYSIGIKQAMAVLMLFAVEYGFNSKAAVGLGVSSASNTINTGTTVGNITSGTQDNKTTAVNYRGIENMWGNVYAFIDGINFQGTVPFICNNFAFADDTDSGYSTVSFTLGSTRKYISYFGYDEHADWLFLPATADYASYGANPFIGDFLYSAASGWRNCLAGGRWTNDKQVGAFFFACADDSAYQSENAGARLMYVPTAN